MVVNTGGLKYNMEMLDKNIINGNDLLSKFMNLPVEVNFSESWDLLFTAIDKINGMGKEYSFATFKTYVSLTVEKSVNKMYKDFSFAHAEYITSTQTSREAAYKLLIRFILWHNEYINKPI